MKLYLICIRLLSKNHILIIQIQEKGGFYGAVRCTKYEGNYAYIW